MRIAFPVQEDRGLESSVYGHFGSATLFLLVDLGDGSVQTIRNQDRHHAHGACQPLAALGVQVDAVVVGGIGAGALGKLLDAGIQVRRAVEGTVQENLQLFKEGHLPEFSRAHTCAGHQSEGQCG